MFLHVALITLLVHLASQTAIEPNDNPITDLVYWREYAGDIPDDAIVATVDDEGHKVYIAQALLYGYGLLPTWIREGDSEVYAYFSEYHTINKHIKILCGAQQNLSWIPTNSTMVSIDLAGKMPVSGGAIKDGTSEDEAYISLSDWHVGRFYITGPSENYCYYSYNSTYATGSHEFSVFVFNV